MRLIAKKPGRTIIKLNAKITSPIELIGQAQLERDMEYSDEIEVVIFEDINGKSPFIGRNALLMAPMSEHQLNIKGKNILNFRCFLKSLNFHLEFSILNLYIFDSKFKYIQAVISSKIFT